MSNIQIQTFSSWQLSDEERIKWRERHWLDTGQSLYTVPPLRACPGGWLGRMLARLLYALVDWERDRLVERPAMVTYRAASLAAMGSTRAMLLAAAENVRASEEVTEEALRLLAIRNAALTSAGGGDA